MSALRAAKEAVYAQQGKYFPLVQANFNPTRQQTPPSLTPIPASAAPEPSPGTTPSDRPVQGSTTR